MATTLQFRAPPRATLVDSRDLMRPEIERQPEFHPQLARDIANIAHRLTTAGADGALPTPSVEELGAFVAELRALLDEFVPSIQIVMTAVQILFAALPLDRVHVPLGTQLQWLHSLCVPHLVLVTSFREAEAHINGVKRFLEGQPTSTHAPPAAAQPATWSRALACAMVPFWACRLSASSKHLGAQLAITTRNLCTVVAECALGRDDGARPATPAEALCALVATNSLVAIIHHSTRVLRRPLQQGHVPGSGLGPGRTGEEAQWALAQARMGWQGELLLSGVHVLLELLPPSAAPAVRASSLCHAAAVGLALLLGSSCETLHQLEAMRVMRAHAGRPLDQYAPPGLESSGACFSQRIMRAALHCCAPVRAPSAPANDARTRLQSARPCSAMSAARVSHLRSPVSFRRLLLLSSPLIRRHNTAQTGAWCPLPAEAVCVASLLASLRNCTPTLANQPHDPPCPPPPIRSRSHPPRRRQGQPATVTDAGLVLLCALDGELWSALLAIVPADALRLAQRLADVRWRRDVPQDGGCAAAAHAKSASSAEAAVGSGRPTEDARAVATKAEHQKQAQAAGHGAQAPSAAQPLSASLPQPLSSFLAIGERLLYTFMEHVCALHRRACSDGDASSSQLLLLPLLTASELRQDGFECAAVFFATAHRLNRDA